MLTRSPVEGYVACCASIRDADLTASTAGLRLPALCVVGEEDGATPPALARELARLIPGAGYVTVADAGHLPYVERPDVAAVATLQFAREAGLG